MVPWRRRIFAVLTYGLSGGGEKYLLRSLAKYHDIVKVLQLQPAPLYRGLHNYLDRRLAYLLVHAFRTLRGDLRRELYQFPKEDPWLFKRWSLICDGEIRRFKDQIDVVLEIGTAFLPFYNELTKPYCVYLDQTAKMAEREYPQFYGALGLPPEQRLETLRMNRLLIKKASIVFTMSERTRRSCIEDYGIEAKRVVVVHSGPNLERLPSFTKDYTKNTILFVGRDFTRKGGLVLLKAFRRVREKLKEAKLVIISASKPKIRMPGCTVKGFVKKEELLSLFEEASVFVLPSLYDPFPHVFFEAMAYKTPCIGTDTGGVPEIIQDEENGFIVPQGDVQKLADKIVYLLQDVSLMEEMGTKGRKRLETLFTWDKVARRMAEHIERIVDVS